MKRPRLTPKGRLRGVTAMLVVAFAAACLYLANGASHVLAGSDPPTPLDATTVALLVDAAHDAAPGRLARPPQADGPGTWQVTLIDGSACWKVQVRLADDAATPAGEPALVGCPGQPSAVETPSGTDENIDSAVESAARGFLGAYLDGGDVSRFGQPGVKFALPAPLGVGNWGIDDVHQDGPSDNATVTVTVNAWVAVGVTKTPVTYRLTVVGSDLGPVISVVRAGPPAPTEAPATVTTRPPTTTTLRPTSTTSTTSALKE